MRMLRKMLSVLCAVCLLCACATPACAADELPDHIIHDVLMTSLSQDIGEFGAVGWTVLGQDKGAREWSVYLAAVASRYGFMGGYCVNLSGWSGPCTIVFQKVNGVWQLKDFLEIEDYSEIENIMPKKYKQKYLNGTYSTKNALSMHNEEVRDTLQRLGRTEPLGSYADAGGELPGVITVASNMLPFDEWSLGCTTLEKVEDGVRVVYERCWQKDAGVENHLVSVWANGMRYDWGGTTGTITYTKTQKDSGRLLQTITARASLTELVITLTDDYGTITYTLPLSVTGQSAPQYQQPTVAREGDCRIDTELPERYMKDLPGERHSEWTVDAQATVGETERFTLLKDSCYHRLCHETLANGEWTTDWTNDSLIENHCGELTMVFTPGASVRETPRFARTVQDMLQICSAGEQPAVSIELSKDDNGAWQVDAYQSAYYREFAYLLPDCMLVQDAPFSASSHALYVPGAVNRRADTFNPRTDIFTANDSLRSLLYWDFDLGRREAYVTLGLMDNYADIGGAQVLYLSLGIDKTVPVYTYPDSKAPRAASGKAAVSLNDTVAVFGRQGDWLMVHYQPSDGKHRTGWVRADANAALQDAARYSMPLAFEQITDVVQKKTTLMDDPINAEGTLCTLQKSAKVTILARKAPLYYVEATVKNKTYRGYVESSALSVQ